MIDISILDRERAKKEEELQVVKKIAEAETCRYYFALIYLFIYLISLLSYQIIQQTVLQFIFKRELQSIAFIVCM